MKSLKTLIQSVKPLFFREGLVKVQPYLNTGLIALLLVTGIATFTWAFDPDAPDYGHSHITRSVVVEPGYRPFATVPHASVPHFTATKTNQDILEFSADAVEQLVVGTRAPDFLYGLEGAGDAGYYLTEFETGSLNNGRGILIAPEALDLSAHCDDEQIIACANRIFRLTIAKHDKTEVSQSDSIADRYNAKDSAVNMLETGAALWVKQNRTPQEEREALAYAATARVLVTDRKFNLMRPSIARV